MFLIFKGKKKDCPLLGDIQDTANARIFCLLISAALHGKVKGSLEFSNFQHGSSSLLPSQELAKSPLMKKKAKQGQLQLILELDSIRKGRGWKQHWKIKLKNKK